MLSIRNDILTEQQLRRLNEHKYSASGDTLLDPYMQKFWRWSVEKFPTWFAPNLMTVLGLIVNALTTLILIYYSPDAKTAVPAWTLFLFALGLFIYQTLDACDGKQARRTGSTSTLGELFDHGCDSLSTVFVAISACIAVQLGEYSNLMFYQCIAASALFYAAHWQTYVSAKLRFGKFDVTEAQFCIIAIHLVSAIFGVEIWSKEVPFVHCSLKILTICMIFLGEVNQFFSYFKVVFAGGVGKNGSTVAGTSVLSPCIPIAIVIVSATMIYKKSTTNLVQNNPCLYLLTFGIIIAKITNKLVIAHMTKSEMQYLDSSFIGPFLLFLNQYFNTFLNEYYVLWLALIYSIIDIILYASSCCLQISSFLGIYVFSLKKRPPGKQSFKSQNGREKRYNLRQQKS